MADTPASPTHPPSEEGNTTLKRLPSGTSASTDIVEISEDEESDSSIPLLHKRRRMSQAYRPTQYELPPVPARTTFLRRHVPFPASDNAPRGIAGLAAAPDFRSSGSTRLRFSDYIRDSAPLPLAGAHRASTESEVRSLKELVAALERTVVGMKTEFSLLRDAMYAAVSALEREETNTDRRVTALQRSVEGAVKRVAKLESSVKGTGLRCSKLGSSVVGTEERDFAVEKNL
ncbi:uncharacterized protein K452DRAFT_309534 [Aplosporella prunicola CBS 121167]|uniref:Uncharacterized protein n=1 Tax=Aplosporella prunicola CBS 121167 TaxID=1176127 RepID=A0A6A6BF38_9PEZI|nr:uncharacterized protein K452DRAFT_309534 [Aplosporella prunicola CBS 121167]KAF2141101.1 hypothetical protein K452DRAFT_309534 [Aplosporella prunicola CBS 121167]